MPPPSLGPVAPPDAWRSGSLGAAATAFWAMRSAGDEEPPSYGDLPSTDKPASRNPASEMEYLLAPKESLLRLQYREMLSRALANSVADWRTPRSLAKETGVPYSIVREILNK